jgi:hypothetical protein
MQIYPVLLLDPQVERTVELAALLTAAGFPTRVEATASDALQAMSEDFFVAVIVVADLDNRECLARLVDLRRAAVHTWMIVVSHGAMTPGSRVDRIGPQLQRPTRRSGPASGSDASA